MKASVIERRVGTGEEAPESTTLNAGELTVDFVVGVLRSLRYQGHEVLLAIAYVVRDSNWGAYNPEISDCSVQTSEGAFTVTYRARCVSAEPSQILRYQARI